VQEPLAVLAPKHAACLLATAKAGWSVKGNAVNTTEVFITSQYVVV
jgi:hypothetical protein